MNDAPPPEKLSAAGIFERLLTYADKPWKAVVILVGLIFAGLGWMIWTERGRIADYVLTDIHQHATLNEDAFAADAPRLLRETRAGIAMLVQLSLIDNLLIDRVSIDTDGNRWLPIVGPQMALRDASSMPLLIRFLANETVCSNTAESVGEDVRLLAEKGYVRYCLVAVPPILGTTVGGVIIAWRQPLDISAEARAGIALRSAAMSYAKW